MSKDVTALLLRLLEQCFRFLNFYSYFGLKQLQPHVTPRIIHLLFQHTKRHHITSSIKGNQLSNFFTSLAALATFGYGENLDKMKEKGDPCIFVEYATQSNVYRVYNSSVRVPQRQMTSDQNSSGLEKLNGSNFLDWYRNLRIVLGYEQKLHHLEEALPEAPPATTTVVRNAYTCSVVEQHEIACLKLASMTPEI
ncbi:hypothetical protein Tco_0891912 [Tanacetum coccineum]|uniref:Retrotransposon Copia-like N-terminal domain-containing protein n=1 Tax=Tanacetum coccineum TaxID=301880 RepID=A0ABQ5C4C3_9ASTR